VERLLDELDLAEPAAGGPGTGPSSRPYLLLNMVSTADGRATLGGRSGAIGDRADKELFHGLRTTVDAVMAGAGTVRAERYRQLVRDERRRQIRRERGLAEEPLACVVSGRLALSSEIPLLADPQARVVILTASTETLPEDCRAEIEYIRAAREGILELPSALSELHERFGVRTVLCEGGPHLGETLRILSGPELDPPLALELVGALEHDSHLFLRYKVLAR
jgi:riboflavin biosynthesis pyrimidine reductase